MSYLNNLIIKFDWGSTMSPQIGLRHFKVWTIDYEGIFGFIMLGPNLDDDIWHWGRILRSVDFEVI